MNAWWRKGYAIRIQALGVLLKRGTAMLRPYTADSQKWLSERDAVQVA
jgi:hypothetical protein